MTEAAKPTVPSGRPMAARDLFKFQMVDDPQVSPDGREVAWVKTWLDAEDNGYRSTIVVTDLVDGSSRPLTPDLSRASHPRWSPDGRYIAFLAPVSPTDEEADTPLAVSFLGHLPQLMIVPATGGETRALTALGGGAAQVSWSPDGSRLAFTTLVDPEKGLETLGAPLPQDPYLRFNRDVLVTDRIRWKSDSLGLVGNYYRQIATVTPEGEGLSLLTKGRSDFSVPTWSPDGTLLAVVGNLDPNADRQRRQSIYLLTAQPEQGAEPQELFGLEEMRSTDLCWSPDGTTLAVCGHNDPVKGHYGFQKLWLVEVADGSATCVTEHIDKTLGDYSRNYDMRRFGGADGPRWLPDGHGLFVLVNERGAIHLHRFDVASKQLTPLTTGDQVVTAFSADRSFERVVLLIGDSLNPADLYLLEPGRSSALRRLTHVNKALFEEVALSAPIRFESRSSGVPVDGWIMPPVVREPGKKAPVILYTGGGPGGMRASVFCQEWQLYAAQGYAVINCNARGNYGYGEDFSVATRGKWGDLDYRDNIAYLRDALEAFDFLDPERLAVAGGSYGGYMATWIISRHTEFKAAVVDRCLYNRYSFNGTGDIGFLLDQVEFDKRLPWEATEVYLERSPAQYIEAVKTPTLVVHSEQDHRCPIDQGEQLFMSLKHLGVPTELVRFPNETHELSRGGRPWHRVFRLERYLDWFARYL
ncbi:MAG: S9 family peptidase [Trueperaceae bacterium]|nr:MAG: S9 family peptidase [Trueperaceae bacterium]